MTLSLESYPVPAPGIVGQIVEHEAVLVFPARGEVKVLNEVAARIWSLADGSRSIRDIATALSLDYTVTLEQAEADTLSFITELVQRGILVVEV